MNAQRQSVGVAWLGVLFWFSGLLTLAPDRLKPPCLGWKVLDVLLIAFSAALVPVLINQLLVRFSEEEFYVTLGFLILMVFWLLLWFVRAYVLRPLEDNAFSPRSAFDLKGLWLRLGLICVVAGVMIWTGRAYQHSFYSQEADLYPGISDQTPFMCGDMPDQSTDITLADVRQKAVDVILDKDTTEPLDMAFTALVKNDAVYAEAFRDALLENAATGAYTAPAQSIKWGQYMAAQEIYFYVQVKEAFPNVFSSADVQAIENWIWAVNQRAQTVEWVDWLYAFAFSKSPVGAYENQEIGAGLYAVLEAFHLSPPDLSDENRAYLEAFPRGWAHDFRVLDDAVAYQPVWITNAYFQRLYQPEISDEHIRLSFDWLLAQALPDGAPLGYNYPADVSPGFTSLAGAVMLEDSHLLWLADQALDHEAYFAVLPGAEGEVRGDLSAATPDMGSCLIYGDSGLPEQEGPLAPDKIVLRGGWDSDDLYLLLNLRFTGWHRYKATNTVSLVYAGENLIKDSYTDKRIPWLPAGRAIVRDKRIPRENLSGFLFPRIGLDAVLHMLIGLGSDWAQDPPYYAEVVEFSTSSEMDYAKTILRDWHGWDHSRSITLYRDGPILILDEAEGPTAYGATAIRWNLVSFAAQESSQRFLLGAEGQVSMVLLGTSAGKIEINAEGFNPAVSYFVEDSEAWKLLTVLLPDAWRDAEIVEYALGDGEKMISLRLEGEIYHFSLE